jgi:drug/metabolite transporter (DMT)-like permease
VSALAFEAAGRRAGALTVNLIRLVPALALLSLYSWLVRGVAFPVDASAHAWLWLSLSLVAIKYTYAGVAATLMALVPVLIIPASVLLFGEKVSRTAVIGALVAVAGTVLLF